MAFALALLSKLVYISTTKTTETDDQRDEPRVHVILYHVIWCPKRRKPILTGPIKERCEHLLYEHSQRTGWQILALAISPDHIHLFELDPRLTLLANSLGSLVEPLKS